LFVGRANRLRENAQQIGRWIVVVEWRKCRDRDGARHVAGGVPTHTVGDGN
jgi:hypothetical protein